MRLLFFPVALLLLPCAWSASGAKSPTISAKSVRSDTFPQTEAHYPGGIVARPHVEFANYVGYRPLQLDVYLHADRAKVKSRPLVIWIHGGGWRRGDARQSGAFADYPAVLASLAARGYVVASVDYRLSGEAPFPAAIQDVKAAIRFLRSRAADYGIDGTRVILWGGSAGGHLAALGAATCGVAALEPAASTGRLTSVEATTARPLAESDCVQSAVAWYGPFDLMTGDEGLGSAHKSDNVSAFIRCASASCNDVEKAASPITYVTRDTPPMLLIHGTADDQVSHHQSEAMAAAMTRAGASVETLYIPGANHGLFGKTVAETRRFSLSALERTFAFFDRITRR